jgi:hypothetical protein
VSPKPAIADAAWRDGRSEQGGRLSLADERAPSGARSNIGSVPARPWTADWRRRDRHRSSGGRGRGLHRRDGFNRRTSLADRLRLYIPPCAPPMPPMTMANRCAMAPVPMMPADMPPPRRRLGITHFRWRSGRCHWRRSRCSCKRRWWRWRRGLLDSPGWRTGSQQRDQASDKQ